MQRRNLGALKFDRLIDNPLRRNRFEFDGTARLGVFEDFQIAGIGIAAGQRSAIGAPGVGA